MLVSIQTNTANAEVGSTEQPVLATVRNKWMQLTHCTCDLADPAQSCPAMVVLFLERDVRLYTSGSTGKPKGVLRDTGGYAEPWLSIM